MLRNSYNTKRYKIKNIEVVIPIKREEMLKTILDFFKSIDESFYKQAIKIILQQNKNIKMNIYNIYNIEEFNKRNEFNMSDYTTDCSVQSNNAKVTINIPTQLNLNEKEAEVIYDKDTCMLQDMYTVVHEIAHLFDLNLKNTAASKDEIVEEKRNRKVIIARELLGESTAIAFEGLLTEYLLHNQTYSEEAVKQIANKRIDDGFKYARLVYAKLLLATEKEKNEKITKEYIEKTMKDNRYICIFNKKYST